MKVLKFGGSSVGNVKRIKDVMNIIIASNEKNGRVAVVFSAFQGVTDSLITISSIASTGNSGYIKTLEELRESHLQAVNELVGIESRSRVTERVKMEFNALADILHGVLLTGEVTAKSLDNIMSYGERLSVYIISEALRCRGIEVRFTDSRRLIICSGDFGAGRVDFKLTNQNIREYFLGNSDVNIITGFIASTVNGETITLGRGGSDYTASIFGAAMEVAEIEIWTDVDGVMSADPRKVKEAFSIGSLTYEEAMEMSHFGAKVIYPPTMVPAMERGVPIKIMNTLNPEFKGTVIGKKNGDEGFEIKGISSIDRISVLLVQGSGMVGVTGISKRIFTALAQVNVNVILISQASSEHSLCIAVLPQDSVKAKESLEFEFRFEIQMGLVNEVSVREGLSIITVVGSMMKNTPGSAGKLFGALGVNRINIVAIAQGSSELNISAVIDSQELTKALKVIHNSYFGKGLREIEIYLAGTGLIGKELIRQIEEQSARIHKESKLQIKVVAAINSGFMLFNSDGLRASQMNLAQEKEAEVADFELFVKRATKERAPYALFVDCTPSESIAQLYPQILSAGISIVTPNKRANSGSYELYLQIKEACKKSSTGFLYETCVGAGLPVIGPLRELMLCGDRALVIEGVLSGTLSFIFNSYNGSVPFSALVKGAMQMGYTEPDPREDLNGKDVGRKLLILAREAGYKIEPESIVVESLIPDGVPLSGGLEEFFMQMERYDNHFKMRYDNAVSGGRVLRYVGRYSNGVGSVSLCEVDASSPFYYMKSSDNMICFKTKYYNERPMVIQGPGAGAVVTACGVLGDIIKTGMKRYEN
ncbi:MAG: bifunctional aspartate kinase/homoserine dehydrogenase I [Bacteroidetes bacterium RIFOXYA12_FULL_40_10]|nr:MAG: bifunctional aspartate kinase/homoserine dehydrogenase I [Bacteroidetes bacterium RIFOXYA12_FULL_40_10]HBG24343.1 bifunctional aspartate kinase/homoserine dehydrogenase I [Rikenellaceae bacterium]